MPPFQPFRAIRFSTGADLERVTSPPYDIITPEEHRRLEASDPRNVVRLILGRTDAHPDTRYAAAAADLRRWLADGVLERDEREGLFLYRTLYRIDGKERVTDAVVGALGLERFGAGAVFPHERTMDAPKADRLALMEATAANLEPIWLVSADPLDLAGVLARAPRDRDLVADIGDPEWVRHRVWRLEEEDAGPVTAAIGRARLVIADGHHRYETSLAYRDARRAREGGGPWDFTLALVSDPTERPPALRPIHRVVWGADAARLGGAPGLTPFDSGVQELAVAAASGAIGVAAGDRRWTLSMTDPVPSTSLAPVLERVGGEVRYAHDLGEVEMAVQDGALCFLVPPVPLRAVIEAALAGRRMPPKTTLFWPKPRTGLLMRDLVGGR